MAVDKNRIDLIIQVLSGADKKTFEAVMFGLIDDWVSRGGDVNTIPTIYNSAKENMKDE